MITYESTLEDGGIYYGCKVVNDLQLFKRLSDVIIANRNDNLLKDVSYKTYTRDIYMRD